VSILSFLGLSDQPARAGTAEASMVREIVEALDNLDEDRARFIAAFGYLLGRVANADLRISPEETQAMERIIVAQGSISAEQAGIVARLAAARNQLFGGTENFLVTREFNRVATRQEKLALLDCLFAIASAEDGISTVEDNEIRQIVHEIGLGHPDFIAVRAKWKDHLAVLKNLPRA
jgi:uncharacterized tellurite resistance protein B-like protein